MDTSRRALLLALVASALPWPAEARQRLAALGRRYRALRDRTGEKPGFNPDKDRWGSELHRVMTELGTRLGTGAHRTRTLRSVMGEPDEIATSSSEGYTWGRAENRRPETVELWIYFWRGWHDYLYFEVDGRGRVPASGWWMAGD